MQLHVEGIAGEFKGQHVKFWIFSTVAVWAYYFLWGPNTTEKFKTYHKKANRKILKNKMVELFRGWDWDFKTNWEKSDYPGSQFFILYGDRDTRKGRYAILELHKPGQSQKLALEDSDIPLEKALFSSYRSW